LALGLWWLASVGAVAQMPAPAVHFTVFSAARGADVAFTSRPNAAAQKLVFYPTARSPRYEYRGAMPLRFTDATTGSVVAEANIPPDIHDALLLFLPVETSGTTKAGFKYQIAVLDDGAARQAAGGLAILNLSGLALTGAVGSQNVTLKAGLNPPVPFGRAAKVMLRTTFKERSYQSYAGTVQLGAKQRALLILFPPFYKGSLEVQSRLLIDEPMAPGR
jgi:hypothetical protein